MTKLLLDESPILILPSLARKVGLNESIFIQQLHYWLKDSKNIRDGHKWVYNTHEDWQEQFPFWSISTIRRTITNLEKNGLIIVGNYNKMKIDKTKWYRINYELLDMSSPCVQNEQSECSKWTDEPFNLNRPLPEITTEITTKKKEEVEEAAAPVENPFHFFEANGFGTIGGYIADKINGWIDDLSNELVLEAMKIAVERGAKTWSYVERILRDWADKKFTTVGQVHAAMLAFKESQSKQRNQVRYNNKPTRTEKLPEWFDEPPPAPTDQVASESPEKKLAVEEKLRRLREGGSNGPT